MEKKKCEHCGKTFYRHDEIQPAAWMRKRFCTIACTRKEQNARRRGKVNNGIYLKQKERLEALRYGYATRHLNQYLKLRFS